MTRVDVTSRVILRVVLIVVGVGLALDGEPRYGTIDGIYGLDALPIR